VTGARLPERASRPPPPLKVERVVVVVVEEEEEEERGLIKDLKWISTRVNEEQRRGNGTISDSSVTIRVDQL